MANFITNQKGQLLTTTFPAFRGDGSIGGYETMVVTVDLSTIGSGTTTATLGTQSTLPNAGLGLAAGDTIDIAVLPSNMQIQAVQLVADTNAPSPDVLPSGVTGTGTGGTLTALTYSLGRVAVSAADRATAVVVTGFTAAGTTYATLAALVTASAINQSALVYTTGTDFLPAITPAASGSLSTVAPVYVLRLTVGAITGTATNLRTGKFRFRLSGIVNDY